MSTGVYAVAVRARLKRARADVDKCRKTLAMLTNQESGYAHELRQLLVLFESVEEIYCNAQDEP